jgi:FkbM family methyltransferase
VTRYTTKRWLLRPLTAVRRRRARRLGEINHAVFEAADYRPAIRRFVLAARTQPGILTDVDLSPGAVVLDVGAYDGGWSRRLLRGAETRGQGDLRIYAFEPEPTAIQRFRDAFVGDRRVELLPFGLGARSRTEQLTISGPGSSIFVERDGSGATQIEIRDVDDVLTSLGVERLDFVKINIEGGEFELIDRLHESGWLARTGTVIVQFHEFGPDAYRGRRRNRRQLAETHRCTWCYPWVFERWDPR